MKLQIKSIVYLIAFAILIQCAHAQEQQELNVYSARKEALIKPLLDKFATDNDIKINLVTGKADALIQRLKSEGEHSPADVFITVDAGRLHRAKQAGLLQVITDRNILVRAPKQYRDPNGYWIGLSLRARAIVYNPINVKKTQMTTYEDLADPRWNKQICVRSSNNIYNQSLVASLIAHHGVEATQTWANNFVKNFARKPQGGDRDQVKAVASGQCDLAVVNTYYFGNMVSGTEEERAAAAKVKVFWPNQGDRGVHMNVSGVGIAKHASNKQRALELIQYLLTQDAQSWYASINSEFPVVSGVESSEVIKSWGALKADTLLLSQLGELNSQAVKIMDKAQWR